MGAVLKCVRIFVDERDGVLSESILVVLIGGTDLELDPVHGARNARARR